MDRARKNQKENVMRLSILHMASRCPLSLCMVVQIYGSSFRLLVRHFVKDAGRSVLSVETGQLVEQELSPCVEVDTRDLYAIVGPGRHGDVVTVLFKIRAIIMCDREAGSSFPLIVPLIEVREFVVLLHRSRGDESVPVGGADDDRVVGI